MTGRYFFGDSKQAFPLGLIAGGTGAPGFDTVTPTRVNVLSLSYTKVIKPALLLEIRGGYNRFHETFAPEDSFDPGSVGLQTLGAGTSARDLGMPLIAVSGFSTFGSNLANPRGRTDKNYQLFGNMTWTRGNHNWKWGYEWRRTAIDGYFDAGYRGKLSSMIWLVSLPGRPQAAGPQSGSLTAPATKTTVAFTCRTTGARHLA